MKIAVMMRAMDQDSGFRAIVEGFVDGMLRIDRENEYLLLYRTKKLVGRFSSLRNVKEVLLKAPSKFLWDQVAVPYYAWRKKVDVIFNPKFSIPLISHCPVTMGLQEPGYWTWPTHYPWWDRWYQKNMIPIYCWKASHIFPNSQFIYDESKKYLRLPLEKTTVAYSSPHREFRVIEDDILLESVRKKYQLPAKFILCVTRVLNYAHNQGQVWDRSKNIETAVAAFNICKNRIPHKLVIAGRQVNEYLTEAGWNSDDIDGIQFLDFVPREDMPSLYNLADLFVIPSFYEGCPNTLLEALACGCPIIASETGACSDVAGNAALLADPHEPAHFASNIQSVLSNEDLRQELKKKSEERAGFFNWERTGQITLGGLTRVVKRQ